MTATKRTSKKSKKHRVSAFAAAERLASSAVREWAVEGVQSASEVRNNHLHEVFRAWVKERGDDSYNKCYRVIAGLSPDAESKIWEDRVMALYCDALDAGYTYGLAVGLALGKGGAR